MNNVCSGHELKAAEYAQRAALNYKKAVEYNDSGNIEMALHHALLAATELDHSSQHAKKVTDFYVKTIIDNMFEFLDD